MKPTEPRGRGGKKMRTVCQNKPRAPPSTFIDVLNLLLTLKIQCMKKLIFLVSFLLGATSGKAKYIDSLLYAGQDITRRSEIALRNLI